MMIMKNSTDTETQNKKNTDHNSSLISKMDAIGDIHKKGYL